MRINLNASTVALGPLLSLACAASPAPQGGPNPLDSRAPEAMEAQPSAQDEEPTGVERRVALMGTWLTIEVDAGQRAASLQASEAALRSLERTEARLSTWREESELSRLNRHPVGERFELSPELNAELVRAQELWRLTEGAFDPGIGAVLVAWGVRVGGRLPSEAELASARADGGLAALELAQGAAIRRHAGLQLEEGGFGKGAGLDLALTELRQAGASQALLDLGGQVALLGEGEVSLGLAHPRDRERALLRLSIDAGSLATSGNSERGFELDGVRHSHLIDPRSGRPAPDYGSLSVWAPDATLADALSTGLYVMGPERALAWAMAHDQIEVIAIIERDSGPLALATPGWRGRLQSLDSQLELQFVQPE